MCAMAVTAQGVHEGLLWMKYIAGSQAIMAQVWKSSWRIPAGTRASLDLMVDRFSLGTVDAVAIEGTELGLGWSIPLDVWRTTTANVLMNGVMARIDFHNGNEPMWQIRLAGSSAALRAFHTCGEGLGSGIAPATTQPY
jgi:hypothetical protein